MSQPEKTSTLPIFRVLDDGVEFYGSGVLMTYGNRHFAGTSGHVIDRVGEHSALLGGCSPPLAIKTPFWRNKTNLLGDPIDFAAVELTREEATHLTQNLRFESLDLESDYCDKEEYIGYRLAGYPASRNYVDCQNGSLSANQWRIDIQIEKASLDHDLLRKKNRKWYLAGSYCQQRMRPTPDAKFTKIEHFSGFSGGSFHGINPFSLGKTRHFEGLAVECCRYKNGQFLIKGIRTRSIVDMLHHWFPSLPEPKVIKGPTER